MDENKQDLFESIPPTVHYTTFGKRLREIRIERELTQTEFAKLLGT